MVDDEREEEVSDLPIMAITFVTMFCLMMVVKIRQHRKTKNAALAIIDGQWALVVGREDSEKLMYLRRLVEQMTMAETLGMSAKEVKK